MCRAPNHALHLSGVHVPALELKAITASHKFAGISWGAICEKGNGLCCLPICAAALAALELMARFHKGFQLDPRRLPSPAQAEQALASPVDHSQVHS